MYSSVVKKTVQRLRQWIGRFMPLLAELTVCMERASEFSYLETDEIDRFSLVSWFPPIQSAAILRSSENCSELNRFNTDA